jgi:hypothetical protein
MSRLVSIVVIVMGLAIVAAVIYGARWFTRIERECERVGGVMVRRDGKLMCVKVYRAPLP